MSRTGKIARLPHDLREEVNHLMECATPGRILLAWLNELPEVKEILAAFFHGKPINHQNLSEWRHGGFAEWLTRKDILDRAAGTTGSTDELEKIGHDMADRACRLLSARLADTVSHLTLHPDVPPPAELKHLSSLIPGLTALRRASHGARNGIPPRQPKPPQHPRPSRSNRESGKFKPIQANPDPPIPTHTPTLTHTPRNAPTPPLPSCSNRESGYFKPIQTSQKSPVSPPTPAPGEDDEALLSQLLIELSSDPGLIDLLENHLLPESSRRARNALQLSNPTS
ncbi:MAG TPA: hypothetical protein VG796_13520 [Verrucomicrobiales bacterium]|nr:hypothetical protein [Verrucomicrobiales bacterium]